MSQYDVYIEKCDDYEETKIENILRKILNENDILSLMHEGIKVGLKVNLVSAMNPSKAATTHPIIVKMLTKILIEAKAEVIIGDSPGGLYTAAILKNNYKETGMMDSVLLGAKLNDNFEQEIIHIDGKVVKSLDTCSWLKDVDYIINVSKLKSHGMMGLSNSVKNMFGTVPGVIKAQYHYRYPDHLDFADMLIDINEYYKPIFNITDAVIGMEGNGPTQGKPRFIGLIMASKNPYELDMVASRIIGVSEEIIPTLKQSLLRSLSKPFEEISTNMNIDQFIIKDFKNVLPQKDMGFKKGPLSKILKKILQVKPKVTKKECIGCKKCYNICPAKAIEMKNKIPHINRKSCIRCFCCQEFCPVGAMKAEKNFIIKIINH